MYYVFYDPIFEGSQKWGITDLKTVIFASTFMEVYHRWLTTTRYLIIFRDHKKTINRYFKQLQDEVGLEDSNPELIATIENITELPKLYPELFI